MSTSAISGTSQTTTSTSSSSTQAAADALGQQEFLTLLVAQLEHQDPLNPSDPTEFTSQLAQYSQLEQLFNLNDGMESLVTTFNSGDNYASLNTIGKVAAFAGNSMTYSGDPVGVGYTLSGTASEVNIVIEQGGKAVATVTGTEFSKGTHYFTWDGTGLDGNKLENGDYTVSVNAYDANGEAVSVSPVIRSTVTGVDLSKGLDGTLITESGEIAVNKVLGVYDSHSA